MAQSVREARELEKAVVDKIRKDGTFDSFRRRITEEVGQKARRERETEGERERIETEGERGGERAVLMCGHSYSTQKTRKKNLARFVAARANVLTRPLHSHSHSHY